jgi:hypothetical protein
VALPLAADGTPHALAVRQRTWADAWAEADCPACGRPGQWPQPQFDCPCGVTIRLAVQRPAPVPAAPAGAPEPPPAPDARDARDAAAGGRPPFRPLPVRTGTEAVTAAAHFLRWLGFADVRAPAARPASVPRSRVDVRGPAVVALVDAAAVPTAVREVETLWLHAMAGSVLPVAFSLAGFDRRARARAEALDLPLFVFDSAGRPRPLNRVAHVLTREGPAGLADR